MRKIGTVLICLMAAVIATGCAKAPVKITYYEPVITSPEQKIEVENNQKVIKYSDNDYGVSAAMAGSQGIIVAALRIASHTGKDIKADEYTVELLDGRDLKPLKLVSREVIVEYRNKLSAGQEIKTGNGMLDLALTQFSGIVEGMGRSERSEFIRSVDLAIDHYFAFRTIYVNEPREGVLSYYADFILEYPLTLRVKLRDKQIDLRFNPS